MPSKFDKRNQKALTLHKNNNHEEYRHTNPAVSVFFFKHYLWR